MRNHQLDRRLKRYALAAASAAAASQNQLDAGVILRNLNLTLVSFSTTNVDVNLDGTQDFSFVEGNIFVPSFLTASRISPLDALASVDQGAGVLVNAGTAFQASRSYVNDSCGLAPPVLPFLGFKLHLADGDHYGYFKTAGRTEFGLTFQQVATLVSVAYESQAGVGILTDAPDSGIPEPGSLALLALGAAGLAALRRKWGQA